MGGWVIDVSRTQPVHTRAWKSRLASYGIGLLEVVVVVDAESTAPLLLVAGPPIDEDVVAPVLSALGRPVHVGPLGAAVALVSPGGDVGGVVQAPAIEAELTAPSSEPGPMTRSGRVFSLALTAAERRLLGSCSQQTTAPIRC